MSAVRYQNPAPCKGGCGKMLRPRRATPAEYPGTVFNRGNWMCGSCYRSADIVPEDPALPEFDVEAARRHLGSWMHERHARIKARKHYAVGDVIVQYNPLNDVSVLVRDGGPIGATYGLEPGITMAGRCAGPARTMAELIPGLAAR